MIILQIYKRMANGAFCCLISINGKQRCRFVSAKTIEGFAVSDRVFACETTYIQRNLDYSLLKNHIELYSNVAINSNSEKNILDFYSERIGTVSKKVWIYIFSKLAISFSIKKKLFWMIGEGFNGDNFNLEKGLAA